MYINPIEPPDDTPEFRKQIEMDWHTFTPDQRKLLIPYLPKDSPIRKELDTRDTTGC